MRKHRLKEERHIHKHKQKRHHHRKHKKKKLPKASDTSNARRMSTHTVVMTEAQKKTTKERRRLSVNAATLPTPKGKRRSSKWRRLANLRDKDSLHRLEQALRDHKIRVKGTAPVESDAGDSGIRRPPVVAQSRRNSHARRTDRARGRSASVALAGSTLLKSKLPRSRSAKSASEMARLLDKRRAARKNSADLSSTPG